MREQPDWPGRFAVIDEMLTARLARSGAAARVRPEVGHAWRLLLKSDGLCNVAALAAETGWSDRHLRSRFREETGLTPKAAGRVIRFDRARRRLQDQATSGDLTSLAGLAADFGYYDQAHLAREFRDLAGCPPSVWVSEEFADEFRNVQASADGAVPGSGS
jgi:AraC-like DNA-binding protein